MSDHSLRSLERSRGISPADSAAYLAAWMRAGEGCEGCAPEHLPKGVPAGQVLADIQPFSGGTRPAFTARLVPCPSCAGTGSTRRARVALAAWCGDEGARLTDPLYSDPSNDHIGGICPCADCYRGGDFPAWLSSLSRWSDIGPAPGWVLARAAVAAARVARAAGAARDPTCCCGSGMNGHGWGDGHSFVHACDYYRLPDCECPEHDGPARAIEAAEAWLECPCEEHRVTVRRETLASVSPFAEGAANIICGAALDHTRDSFLDAARLAGGAPVRDAIRTALIGWALKDKAP